MKDAGKRRNARACDWSVDSPKTVSGFLFVFMFASKSLEMFADPVKAPVPSNTFSDHSADRTSDVPEA